MKGKRGHGALLGLILAFLIVFGAIAAFLIIRAIVSSTWGEYTEFINTTVAP